MSRRVLRRMVGVFFLGAIVGGLVGYRTWTSEQMRRQIIRELEPMWGGSIVVDKPRYSPFGPMEIGAVSFFDSQHRLWARASKIGLIFDGWPILGSWLQEIQVQDLEISWSLDPNHPMPLNRSFVAGAAVCLFGPVRVDRCSVDLLGPTGSRVSYPDLTWQLKPVGDQLQLLLIRNSSDPSDFLFADLQADLSDSRISGRIDLAHAVSREEIRLYQPWLAFPQTLHAEGYIRAELDLSGTAPDFEDLQLDGSVSVADAALFDASDRPLLQEGQASLQFADHWVSVDPVSARIGEGILTADLMATWSRSGVEDLTGQLSIQAVDLARCGPWLPKDFPLNRGRANLDYVFFRPHSRLPAGGYGRLRLTDADLMQLPVIPDLFTPLGLPLAEPVTLSDGLLDFTHSGPTVQIGQARIFNSVAALIAEPGGTIRLDDGNLDLYVVGAPIQLMEDLLSKIPVVRIFNRAANKLVRLHVLGNWSDPPDRLIRPEPIENLQQSANGLLEDLVRGGADLTDRIRRTGRSLWDDVFGDKSRSPMPVPVPR